jgi:glutamate carboxypeptidase
MAQVHGNLAHLSQYVLTPLNSDLLVELAATMDGIFLATPHEASHDWMEALSAGKAKVFDLSGAFRLKDTDVFAKHYGFAHTSVDCLDKAVYGLAEYQADALKDANIEIHMTGDEEDAGDPIEKSRADLIAAGKRSDIALDFEGLVRDNGADMGSIARRSSESWTVTATGMSAHSSGIFSAEVGDGAINELARIIRDFRTELPEPNLTFNVGLIAGGQEATLDTGGIRATANGKTNIVAPIAVARGDLRTLSPEQSARVKDKMAAIVARHLPGTDAKLAFDPGAYPPMAPTAGNKALLDRLNGVNRDMGLPEMAALDPLKRGAGDISFVAADVDGLAGLGTYSTGDHAPGERVELSSIARQATRAAILMSRIAAEKR